MKTHSILPVALLIAAGLFSVPGATADPQRQTVEARFVYSSTDTAANIYADLQRTARKACAPSSGKRPISVRRFDRDCVKQMVDEGVAKIGRPDIAALHNGSFATVLTDSRG